MCGGYVVVLIDTAPPRVARGSLTFSAKQTQDRNFWCGGGLSPNNQLWVYTDASNAISKELRMSGAQTSICSSTRRELAAQHTSQCRILATDIAGGFLERSLSEPLGDCAGHAAVLLGLQLLHM